MQPIAFRRELGALRCNVRNGEDGGVGDGEGEEGDEEHFVRP
jgi:hypothetical protein